MQRKEIESIGDILRAAIEESRMTSRLDQLQALDYWPLIVGKGIADQCMRPYVKDGVITVRVPNAALRNELHMERTRITAQFNRLMKKDVIISIRFIS